MRDPGAEDHAGRSSRGALPSSFLEGLEDLVESSELQVVRLRSLPGQGVERALLSWIAEGRAVSLTAATLSHRDRFRAFAEAARDAGARGAASSRPLWLVATGGGGDPAVGLEKELLPGERLVLAAPATSAAPKAHPWAVPMLRLEPSDLALRPADVLDWARERSGTDVPESVVDGLIDATGGWLRPLELALASPDLDSWLEDPGGDPGVAALLRSVDRSLLRDTPFARLAGNTAPPAAVGPEPGREACARIRLELLGLPRIRIVPRDGQSREVSWPYRGVLELLAFLAVAPERTAGRDELLDRLWPRLDPGGARKQLYPAISHLRGLFDDLALPGSAVESAKGTYSLREDWPWFVDVENLRAVVAATPGEDLLDVVGSGPAGGEPASAYESRLEGLVQAWRGIRGDFLEGVPSAWVGPVREECRRLHLELLERLVCAHSVSGDDEAAEEALRTLLVHDPAHESAHVAMMRLYSRRGRTDLVRRQYERMCSVLFDELGMQPMDRSIREAERLLT